MHPTCLQHIRIPGIPRACQDPSRTITLFPNHTTHTPTTITTQLNLPLRPLPRTGPNNTHQHMHQRLSIATHIPTPLTSDTHLPHSPPSKNEWPVSPSIQHMHQHTLPQHHLTVIEFYGATATGLEALPKTGHHIGTFAWTDTSPDALVVVTHRITQLQLTPYSTFASSYRLTLPNTYSHSH